MTNDMSNDVFSGISSVAKKWKKAKRQADRDDRLSRKQLNELRWSPPRITIKDVVYEELPTAYNIVSDNGKYWANARQLFYKVRPKVIQKTDEPWSNSSYFTQTLLKDYIEDYSPDWKVVWDARGHIKEPYTDEKIGLGGVEVGNYIQEWRDTFNEYPSTLFKKIIETKGPRFRYGAVLFIEKEGFNEILEESEISKEFDIGIMSTKGVPVGASCKLANALSNKGVRVFVLHDFDFAGFKIINTLRTGTRLAPGTPDVIDIGLRLEDVKGLESEECTYRQRKDPRIMLKRYGATDEECDFLVKSRGGYYTSSYTGERVELNALTSGEFIDLIRKKLKQHELKKVIPDDYDLFRAYTRAVYCQRVEDKIDEIMDEMQENIDIPKDLKKLVEKKLKNSKSAWDEIIWDIAELNEENGGDDSGN